MMQESQAFIVECQAYLEQKWSEIGQRFEQDQPEPLAHENDDLILLIRDCLTSKIKSYHYVLPTQLLAKAVNQALDAHCLQVSYDRPGAFDARTLAHGVIVPFDQVNYRVLGGSPEPYVNNPLRIPAVIPAYRDQQKAKSDWDKLIVILDAVEAAGRKDFTKVVFEQVLWEIYKLLANVTVLYPTPNRISLKQTQWLIEQYLDMASGGERMEAVCTALFQTIGEEFGIFDQIKREKVNASDASSGMVADIECWAGDKIVLLVEVKDRSLTLTQLDLKLDVARSEHIAEILFIARNKKATNVTNIIEARILSEFASGQNIYVANFSDFSLGIFILLGEKGRINFLDKVGKELDRVNTGIVHRKAWAVLLRES